MPSSGNPCVVVTGFGPFRGHAVNASWVAVKELAEIGLHDGQVELIIYEIPVIYEEVKKIIPELWNRHNPIMMVHVGVSSMSSELTLEQLAHNDGYNKCDVQGCTPSGNICIDDSCHQLIESGIDMSQVCEGVNAGSQKVKSVVSRDPGRYLCDFTYFQSLHCHKNNTAFIHVPPLNSPYTASELGQGLQVTLTCMLKQVL